MRTSVRLLLVGVGVAVVATAGVVVVGTLTTDAPPARDQVFSTTALEDFDTSAVTARRAPFCSAIDPRQVEAALGAEPEGEESWSNGDRIKLRTGQRDIVHEYGCKYVAPDGSIATAWVFAPPIEERRAKHLAKARGRPGGWCTGPVRTAATFGEPSSMLSCLVEGAYLTSYQGLFGDAWLTCELSVTAPPDDEPPPDLDVIEDRTGRWCVGVALAASSEPVAES